MTGDTPELPTPREVKIDVHDGEEIAMALYMSEGDGPFRRVPLRALFLVCPVPVW